MICPSKGFRRVIAGMLLLLVQSAYSGTDSLKVTLLITGGFRGRVNGCECPGGATGGLAHRAASIEEYFPDQVPLAVDAGGILDLDVDLGRSASRCAIFGLARLGLKVIGVTPRDLFYGVSFLNSLLDSAGMTAVSANIVAPESGKPLFNTWTVVADGGYHLAFTSLCQVEPGQRFSGEVGWIPIAPDSVLFSVSESVPPADLHILLTDVSETHLKELLKALPFLDLVITSTRHYYTDDPYWQGQTLVVHPKLDGRMLEWVEITPTHTDTTRVRYQSRPLLRDRFADPGMNKWLQDCLQIR